MNKREDFRARLFGMECEVHDIYQSTRAEIENLSGTGAAIDLAYDFYKEKLTLTFEIIDKIFVREAVIIYRKSLESGKIRYHVKFAECTERERVELHSALVTHEGLKNQGNI